MVSVRALQESEQRLRHGRHHLPVSFPAELQRKLVGRFPDRVFDRGKLRIVELARGRRDADAGHRQSISDEAGREEMKSFRRIAIQPEAIANAVRFAIAQPADVDTSEIVVRPTASPF